MTGYLNVRQAAEFLGGRSIAWMRLHVHDLPHRKLYDRLLFDPAELRLFVERTATRHVPVDVEAVVAAVMQPKRRRGVTR